MIQVTHYPHSCPFCFTTPKYNNSSRVRFHLAHFLIFCNWVSFSCSTATYQTVILLSSVANNSLLPISSLVRFSLAYFHNFSKTCRLPPIAAMCQAFLLYLSCAKKSPLTVSVCLPAYTLSNKNPIVLALPSCNG